MNLKTGSFAICFWGLLLLVSPKSMAAGSDRTGRYKPFGPDFCTGFISGKFADHLETLGANPLYNRMGKDQLGNLANRLARRDMSNQHVLYLLQQMKAIDKIEHEVQAIMEHSFDEDAEDGVGEFVTTAQNTAEITRAVESNLSGRVAPISRLRAQFPQKITHEAFYIGAATIKLQLGLAIFMKYYWESMTDLGLRPISRPYFSPSEERLVSALWATEMLELRQQREQRRSSPMADQYQPLRVEREALEFAHAWEISTNRITVLPHHIYREQDDTYLRGLLDLYRVNRLLPVQNHQFFQYYADFLSSNELPLHAYARSLLDNATDQLRIFAESRRTP